MDAERNASAKDVNQFLVQNAVDMATRRYTNVVVESGVHARSQIASNQ